MYRFNDYSEIFKPEEILDYLRKSQSDDPNLTVEEVLQKHETILDEWDERNLAAKVPEENRFREIVSGETIRERPEINKVLRLIESPKYKAVKVVEPQRLTRGDLEDIGHMMKLLKHTNTYIITPDRMYDLQDEYDWNAFEAELKRGNDYLKYTKKILNRGRLLSVSQGNYIASIPPYGYDKTWVVEEKRKCPTLIENKEQADIVRTIFDLYVNKDMGRTNIAHYLDNLGIKAPKGKYWSGASIKDILENVHYIGKVKWNWRKTHLVVENGEIKEVRPKAKLNEYLIYEGKHKGIVTEEIFQAARDKQGKNYRAKPGTKIRNPLAGLLFCHCGRAMSLKFFPKPDGSERNAPRLNCDDQVRCNTGSCRLSELTDRLCDILRECISDYEIKIQKNEDNTMKLQAQQIKNLEKKMKKLQAKELSQWEQQSHPDLAQRMPSEIFKQLNEKLLKEKEEVKQALEKAYTNMPEPIDYNERLSRFKIALEALENPEADPALQNKLLKACIEKIEYNREKPERLKRAPGEKKGERFKTAGGRWTNPPIELEVKIKV